MLEAAAQMLGPVDLADAGHVTAARDAYFAEMDQQVPGGGTSRLVIDKLPLAMTGMDVIHRLFPRAPIIFAQRHPADALVSNVVQAFRLNDAMANFLDLADAAEFYDLAMSLWMKSKDVYALDTMDVMYERLIDDPEATLRPLVEWLGLTWKPSMLDHERTAAKRSVIATPSYDQVTKPLHNRAAGRWRRYRAEIAPVFPTLDRWAQRLGYGPIGE